jgi:predicted small secreted protein
MARVAVSAASRKKSLLVVMRGNREFSGVIGHHTSVRPEVHPGQSDELQIPPGNVSAISPGQDEIYELIISHPSMVDSGRIV